MSRLLSPLPLVWIISLFCLSRCATLITGDKHKTPTSNSHDLIKTANDSGKVKRTLLFQEKQLQTDTSTMSWQPEDVDRGQMMPTRSITIMEHKDRNTDPDSENRSPDMLSINGLTPLNDGTACDKSNTFSKHKHRHDGDTFPCASCVCSYQHNNISANCTKRSDDKIPKCLPKDTWEIVFSENAFRTLYLADLEHYLLLSAFTITHNTKLRAVKNVSQSSPSLPLRELNMYKNHIETVDDGSFKQMPDLFKLNLGFNNLIAITNFTFEGLHRLKYLNLSHNFIKVIEYGAFDKLISLLNLDLSKNTMTGHTTILFSPRFFQSLHRLQNLSIEGNSNGEHSYPSELLEELPKLQTLSIDGLASNAAFTPGVKSLKYLTNLVIGGNLGHCYTSYLNATFFGNLPNITVLSFRYCNELRLCNITTQISKYLTTLEIKGSIGYDLPQALQDIRHFQNSSLASLALVRLKSKSGAAPCRSLEKEHARYLQHLQLKVLDLSENFLILLAQDFLQLLPKTLERLILRENKFGLIGIGLDRIVFLSNLIELDLSYQNMERYFYKRQPLTKYLPGDDLHQHSDGNSSLHLMPTSVQGNDTFQKCFENIDPVDTYRDENIDSGYENYEDIKIECKRRGEFDLIWDASSPHMPPNLTIIRAPYFNYFGIQVLEQRYYKSLLQEFHLRNNFLSRLDYGLSVPKYVKHADLSNNYLDNINYEFFKPNNSIVHLLLNGNSLGPDFADDLHGYTFKELSSAEYVDISDNSIYYLPSGVFIGLQSVKTLKISNNRLQTLNVSFAHMKSLSHLDLHKNSITWIGTETRQDLDAIASQHELTIDLRSNPLPCTCAGLNLLYWMANTNVYFMHQRYLECRLENNVLDDLGVVEERVKYLQKHCAPKAEIIVICVACFVLLVVVVGFSMMYRYRWRLRYLRNIAMAKLAGTKVTKNHNYKFDAYVLFSEESQAFVIRNCVQELEVKRGHKLCINVRNFMPGTYEVSNIVAAIQHSARTLAIVSPNFYKEDYSEYCIKMAMMEEIYNRRTVLHLCVYKQMSLDDMAQCPDLLMVMKRDDYTEFPPENEAREEIVQNFWDRLSLAIGHTNQVNALQGGVDV